MLLLRKAEIRKRLREITSAEAGRRVAVVAYIGSRPGDFIEHIRGLEVYCSDNPIGTHPDGIEALLNGGAEVYFVNRLHAKVFWSQYRGALIGSINLSRNAFGDEGLFEAAWSSNDIDITHILSELRLHAKPKLVDDKVLKSFRKRFNKARQQIPEDQSVNIELDTFSDWALKPKSRKEFSIQFWESYDERDLTARELKAVKQFRVDHNLGDGDEYDGYLSTAFKLVKIPKDQDVLLLKLTTNGLIAGTGHSWLRRDLQLERRSGYAGKGTSTKLIQVTSRRDSDVPFKPSGQMLRTVMSSYFKGKDLFVHPGVNVQNGSQSEKKLLRLANQALAKDRVPYR